MIPYKDLNPTRHFPLVTLLLIFVNIFIFGYQITLSPADALQWLNRYAAIPLEFKRGHNLLSSEGAPPFLTLFTAPFLHGGLLHLFGNMIYLWIFGDNVEDKMGKIRFLVFYLLCGTLSILIQVYANFGSRIPIIGASGAVAGILGAYLRLLPHARVAVLIPVFFFLRATILPAWLVLGGWILLQVLSIQLSPMKGAGGIAYYAHIGGFLTGLILMPAFLRARKGR